MPEGPVFRSHFVSSPLAFIKTDTSSVSYALLVRVWAHKLVDDWRKQGGVARCLFALPVPVPGFFSFNIIRAYLKKYEWVVEADLDGVIRIYRTRDEKSSFAIFNSKTDWRFAGSHVRTELSVCLMHLCPTICCVLTLFWWRYYWAVHSTPSNTHDRYSVQHHFNLSSALHLPSICSTNSTKKA